MLRAAQFGLLCRFDRTAGTVRCGDDVVKLQQRVRLWHTWARKHVDPGKHIECRAANGVPLQAIDQRGLVNDRPARGIDQHRIRLHSGQLDGAEQAARLSRQRQVDGNEMAGLQQRIEGHQFDAQLAGTGAVLLRGTGPGLQAQPEGAGTLRNRLRAGAKTEQPQAAPGDPVHPAVLARRPVAAAHGLLHGG